MSRDFRPRPGCRAVALWPADQPPPPGWERSEYTPCLVHRVLDGGPDDEGAEICGYTEPYAEVSHAG